jgi:hypothetical protein
VPKRLEEATATILGVGKRRQSWLKKSLGTKDLRQAKLRAKPVLMEFDGVLKRAEELLKTEPIRTSLTRIEIARMAEFHYASLLGIDEMARRDARQIADDSQDVSSAVDTPAYGLTDAEFDRMAQGYEDDYRHFEIGVGRLFWKPRPE